MHKVRTPPRLARRRPDAHKASVGRVLVVGGSRDMCGAPALCALGALRAGAGLVRVAVPHSVQGVVAGIVPEATTAGLPEVREGTLAMAALGAVRSLLPAWDALVLGPGAGREDATRRFLVAAARSADRPLVLDADGLFALGREAKTLRERKAPTVLTPHEGEAAHLLGCTSNDVRVDREGAALAIAAACGGVVVLKGPATLVTDGAQMFSSTTGGPALATGGSGDVLGGVVGAFLAGLPDTGGDAFGAACAAVHVHGLAGDTAAGSRDRGLVASDIALALPDAITALVGPAPRARKGRSS